MMLTILFVVTVLILIYRHLTRNFHVWKAKNVPYMPPVLVFGNLFSVISKKYSIGEFLYEAYKTTQSAYFGLFLFDQPILLLRDPYLIKHILIKDFDNFIDRGVMNSDHDILGSNMLFLIKGAKWRTLRKKLTPIFTSGKLKSMYPLVEETGNELVKHIKNDCINKESVDGRHIGIKYGADAISSCAFGLKSDSLHNEKSIFLKMAERFFSVDSIRATQMAAYIFAPLLAQLFRFKFLDATAANFMKSVYTNAMRERNKSGCVRGDLIDMLMEIGKTTDLDEDVMVATAIQFLIGGYETTGTTFSFALYELSLNKAIQERLRNEIQTAYAAHEQITYESLSKLNYLDMVLKEVLRRYPILPYLDRICQNTYTLPDTDVVIEKGMGVYISLFGLHNDERYFPNPEKFDPERFSEENISSIPHYTYMPFGEGLRNCIGARFALLALKIAIVKVLLNFKVEPSQNTPKNVGFEHNGFLIAPTNGVLHVRLTSLVKSD